MKHLVMLLISFSMVFAYSSSSRSSSSSSRSSSSSSYSKPSSYSSSSSSSSSSVSKPTPAPVKSTPSVKATPSPKSNLSETSTSPKKSISSSKEKTAQKKKESKKTVFHAYKHRSLLATAAVLDDRDITDNETSSSENEAPDFNILITQLKKDNYKISSNEVNLQTFKVIVKDSSNKVVPVSKATMSFKTKSKSIKVFASNEKYDEEFSFNLK